MKQVEKYNMNKKPVKPWRLLMPVEWGGAFPGLFLIRHKLKKVNCKGLKSPYIVLSNHASFVDFQVNVKATFPHRSHWVISIEEFNGREWLFRAIGGIPKRKFTQGSVVVKHILTAIRKNKKIVTIYPEARFSLAGINEDIGKALGKLVKMADVPVVVLNQNGHFIRSPQWNKHPIRRFKMDATFTCVANQEEVRALTADEIQARIEKAFVYDDYKWQLDNKIKIKSKKRAHNIHKILYQCPHCKKEFMMDSKDTKLWCNNCHTEWEMDYYGQLQCLNGENIFKHVPDWYRWERQNVKEEVRRGNYYFEDKIRLEELINSKVKFIDKGTINLVHDYNGFTLKGTVDEKDFCLNKPIESMASVHIEYDFKKRGDAIDIATMEDTWFVFPLTAPNPLTKLHFAVEELYNFKKEEPEKFNQILLKKED